MAQEGDEARYMTIKDIARQCGVSVSTVSRVLNDRPDVSPENRRKVLSAIQQSNYIPNNTARDLVKTKSDAIGLVVRGVSNPFYTDIIRVIEEQVTARGYTLVMQQIDQRPLSAAEFEVLQTGELKKALLRIDHPSRVQVTPAGRAASSTVTV